MDKLKVTSGRWYGDTYHIKFNDGVRGKFDFCNGIDECKFSLIISSSLDGTIGFYEQIVGEERLKYLSLTKEYYEKKHGSN